jgi:hypothetical protein
MNDFERCHCKDTAVVSPGFRNLPLESDKSAQIFLPPRITEVFPFGSLRPPASPPETLRVTMWAGLRGTLPVAKWVGLREALRAGLGVRSFLASWREVL